MGGQDFYKIEEALLYLLDAFEAAGLTRPVAVVLEDNTQIGELEHIMRQDSFVAAGDLRPGETRIMGLEIRCQG